MKKIRILLRKLVFNVSSPKPKGPRK